MHWLATWLVDSSVGSSVGPRIDSLLSSCTARVTLGLPPSLASCRVVCQPSHPCFLSPPSLSFVFVSCSDRCVLQFASTRTSCASWRERLRRTGPTFSAWRLSFSSSSSSSYTLSSSTSCTSTSSSSSCTNARWSRDSSSCGCSSSSRRNFTSSSKS